MAFDSAGNPAAKAAAEEAATGAWLAELESGDPLQLRAVAPGMGRSLFGGWAAEAGAEAEAAEAAEEQQATAQQAQQQQKVSLDDLFRWAIRGGLASACCCSRGGALACR